MANERPQCAINDAGGWLTAAEYIRLLNTDITELATTCVPPVGAKPGELFVYYNQSRPQDWKADGYRWRDNGRYSGSDLMIKYYRPHSGDGFSRRAYWLPGTQTPVIVHYVGSVEGVEHLCHGNMKRNTREKFIRTAPSQLSAQKTELSKNPSAKYVNLATAEVHPVVASVLLPRNKKQVSNSTTNERDRRLPSKDDVLGVHEVYREIGGFLALNLAPEFFLVYCSEGSTALYKKVGKLDGCVLFYDTMFNIGDFYVSPLIYHHPIFSPKPVVPLAYMVHHTKSAHVHKQFFYLLKNHLPIISDCIIVTDREQAIVKAISDEIPNAKHFVCWNHLQRDVKFWLKKHKNSTPADEETYTSHVWDLLSSNSEVDYLTKKDSMAEHWSQEFKKYFDSELSRDVIKSGKWALKAANVYTEGSGITSNSAESFNAVLKRCTEQKEMKMSVFLLCVYKIDLFYQKEIIRGTCGLGDYKLSCHLEKKFHVDPSQAEFPESVIPLEQIPYVFLDRHMEQQFPVETESLNSTEAMVKSYLAENRVHHIPGQKVFILEGWRGKYIVSLFPNESCSCVAKVGCIHLKAVRCSVGLPLTTQKDVKLSTIMRKDRGKKSGRKGGDRKVVLVEAADDGDVSTGQAVVDEALGPNSVLVPVKVGNVSKSRFYHPSIHDPDSESFMRQSSQQPFGIENGNVSQSEPCHPNLTSGGMSPPPSKQVRFNDSIEKPASANPGTNSLTSSGMPETNVSWNADQVAASTPTANGVKSGNPFPPICTRTWQWDKDYDDDDDDPDTQCSTVQHDIACDPSAVPKFLAGSSADAPAIFFSDPEDDEHGNDQPVQCKQCHVPTCRCDVPLVGCAMCHRGNVSLPCCTVQPQVGNAPTVADVQNHDRYTGAMECLNSCQWFTGSIVEEAIHRLIHKYKKQDSVVLISFVQDMFTGSSPYDRYRNVLRAAANLEALNKDFVLTVMNVNQSHWILGAVCFVSKCILIFDSYYEDLNVSNKILAKSLMKLAYCCHLVAGASFDQSRWKVGSYELKMKQPNPYDCGLFVIYHSALFLDQDQRVFSEIALNSKGHLLQSDEGRRNVYNLFQEDIGINRKSSRKAFVLDELIRNAQLLDDFDPRLKISKQSLTPACVWNLGVKDTCAANTSCVARKDEGFHDNSAYNSWAMCVICRKWWHGPCMEFSHQTVTTTTYYVCRRCL